MAPPSDPDLIQKKVCNAFFTDDQLSKMGYTYGGVGLLLLQAFMKGLWIGGNFSLTSTKVVFEPNALNKLFHSGNHRVEIPLMDIS